MRKRIEHVWGCIHNPAYGGSNHACNCEGDSTMKYWSLDRLLLCLFLGAFEGCIPALPLMLMSSFADDKPAFWLWPFFSGIMAAGSFFGGVGTR